MNSKIIDISTGKIMEKPPVDTGISDHERLCISLSEMLAAAHEALHVLMGMASISPKTLRSIHWHDDHGFMITVPVALRKIRSDVEYLENFFKSGSGK